MATSNDLKNGIVLNIDGQLWSVIDFQHVKPGKGGAFVRTKLKNVLSGKVVDRIGAGDAFLSVSSLLAVQGAPLDVVGFAGNAAGALAVATVANRDAIDRIAYCKQIESLLK